MIQYLLDTNIVSELRKGRRCNPDVLSWYSPLPENSFWLSVVVIAEIRRGIEQIRRKDLVQATHLERWLHGLLQGFSERILPIDENVAERWGYINSVNRLSTMDGLLAATALEHDLVLVTRNVVDVKNSGAQLLNPFDSK